MEYQSQNSADQEPPTCSEAAQDTPETGEIPATEAELVSAEAAELVEKLEYFKVGDEKVTALKTLAIKLEVSPVSSTAPSTPPQTLYTAWSAGALELSYLSSTLASCRPLVAHAEAALATPPWRLVWSRSVVLLPCSSGHTSAPLPHILWSSSSSMRLASYRLPACSPSKVTTAKVGPPAQA